jgi:Concanavalin A-like lectin/glucanases superfamily
MPANQQTLGKPIMKKQTTPSSMVISKLSAAVLLTCTMGQSVQAQTVLDYATRWKFDDCAQATVVGDASGNGRNARRGSMVQCTTDRNGQSKSAALFSVASTGDGSAQTNVTLADASNLQFVNEITLSTVVKPSATPEGALVTKGWTAGTTKGKVFQLALVKESSGASKAQFTVWTTPATGGAPVPVVLTTDIKVAPSKWTRISASYIPGGKMQVFFDGVSVKATPDGVPAIAEAPANASSSIWLGGGSAAQAKGYLGSIDDTWLSNGSCADLGVTRAPDPVRELMITHLSVVESDTVRTTGRGAWTFANLMEQMVPANPSNPQAVQDAAADMVLAMFQTWSTPQTINGLVVPARTRIQKILEDWPKLPNGKLDLTRAPVRLLAIVNRMDVRNIDKGSAGEGRFVFGVLDAKGNPRTFTMIFEYNLPAQTLADVRQWGKLWHDLGNEKLETPEFNTALQGVTDKFSRNGLQFGRPNGNPINQVRTNEIGLEIGLEPVWELREFNLGVTSAGLTRLLPAPVKNNPDLSFNAGGTNAALLTKYINDNVRSILLETHETPAALDANGKAAVTGGTRFTAGSSINDTPIWNASGLVIPQGTKLADGKTNATVGDLMHKFAINTCNGCHNSDEANSGFLQIGVRGVGDESILSGFLTTTTTITDPRTSEPRVILSDLDRRATDLQTKVIASCPAPAPAPAPVPVPAPVTTAATTTLRTATALRTTSTTSRAMTTNSVTSLGKGTGRVH